MVWIAVKMMHASPNWRRNYVDIKSNLIGVRAF